MNTSKITGWKTFIAAMIMAVVGVAESTDFTNLIDNENSGTVMIIISAVVGLLRAFTKTPIFKSGK